MTPQEIRDRLKALIREKCLLKGDFVLASGQRSPVYFDCKRCTLDPEGIHLVSLLILDEIEALARKDGRPFDAIGGPTIGADPIVGHVAGLSWERWHAAREAGETLRAAGEAAGAPGGAGPAAPNAAGSSAAAGQAGPVPKPLRAFLVRKEVKEHGTRRVIENEIPPRSRVAIFEDVVTTGHSTLEAVRKAQESGLEVAAVIAIIDREAGGTEALGHFRYHPFFMKSEFGL